jgi:O-antigen/teichoic acid export membrane protein
LKQPGNKILHNSYWLTIEMALETIVFMGSSIAVARYFGPTKLGYYSYINFFITTVQRTGATGLSMATRKYLSEYVALDRPGMVRAVYNLSYGYQLIFSLAIAGVGIACVLLFGDPNFRLMSCILLASVVPGLMSWVPAQLNQAYEDVANNTISAFGYMFSYAAVIALTIHFHWDLVGIAAATFISRTVEVIWRTIPVNRRLRVSPIEKMDLELKKTIRRFALQAVWVQVVIAAAFDRTELIFLRIYSTLDQMAYYSVAASLMSNLLTPSRILGNATAVTLMVEAVKDPLRVTSISRNACRYILLIMLPVGLGAIAVMEPLVRLVYGTRYVGAIAALIVATAFAIPRSLQWLTDVLLRIADRQKQLILWYSITAIFNVAVDLILIPRYGSTGAAWGNGLGQFFGVVCTWILARQFFVLKFPVLATVRLTVAAGFMAGIAYLISHTLPNAFGVTLAVLAAIPAYLILLRLVGALETADKTRLVEVAGRLPRPLRKAYVLAVNLAAPARS